MKITGGSSYINFDMENGHVMKAKGEMLTSGKLVVFKNSMNLWEYPFEDEQVTEEIRNEIIKNVREQTNENTIQISFE